MSEKGRDILTSLLTTVSKLDESKQNYLLGMADCMAITRESADQVGQVPDSEQLVEA